MQVVFYIPASAGCKKKQLPHKEEVVGDGRLENTVDGVHYAHLAPDHLHRHAGVLNGVIADLDADWTQPKKKKRFDDIAPASGHKKTS